MKLLSIVSLVLLAVPASALPIQRSSKHVTKEDRRLARERNAAANGGRRLDIEDCPGEIPAFLKFFAELTDPQVLAAAKLGYSADMWDDDKYPEKFEGKKWEELPPGAQANFMVLGIDAKVFGGYYSSIFWGKMDKIDAALQPAAAILGYTKDTWNTCYHSQCTDVQKKSWFDLTQEQRQAARVIGYSCHTWEYWLGPNNVDLDECVTPYYKRMWDGLPVDQKRAAKLLGYNQESWDGSTLTGFPETWDELTNEQQKYFAVLGYTQAKYNEIYYYSWTALPSAIQTAAQILNLNQKTWDRCEAVHLGSCTKLAFTDLTLDQKVAAEEIGFTCDDYDE